MHRVAGRADSLIQALLPEIRSAAAGFDEPLGAYSEARAQRIKVCGP